MSLLTKRAIADALITALTGDPAHDEVKLFIRGWAPMPVPIDKHPFYEVAVMDIEELGEFTGKAGEHRYVGVIKVNVLFAQGTERDWIEPVVNRVLHLPTYDKVEELLDATHLLLKRPEYHDLAGLTVEDTGTGAMETVQVFSMPGPRELGSGEDERGDNFTNFGILPFQVDTIGRYPLD